MFDVAQVYPAYGYSLAMRLILIGHRMTPALERVISDAMQTLDIQERRPPMEIIYIFIGFAIGLVAAIIYYGKPQGNLRVDRSDSDGPYFFLEINKPISSILK